MPAKMPPHLDISAATHPKMIVAPPRLNLRRAASYNHDKGPLSSTSSRFNFNHLLFSPPPSPGLPALIPRPRKSPTHPRPSRVIRLLVRLAGVILVFYFAVLLVRHHGPTRVLHWPIATREEYEMVGQNDLPDFPTPIAATDSWGRSIWTVSIPPTYDFPLSIKEYADMTSMCREVSAHVGELRGNNLASQQMLFSPDKPDPYFVDVREAEESGLLPGMAGNRLQPGKPVRDGDVIGEIKDSLVEMPLCKTTMTFVLETDDAGMGNTLMMLWTFYGIAKKEGRTFFIDDTRWAYGKYTDIFQPPAAPDCRPPPRHEMLPCPLQARHLIVSTATVRDVFGHSLRSREMGPRWWEDGDLRALFDLAHEGYRALFQLNDDDRNYVEERARHILDKDETNKLVIGLHIRRGDRHPLEYQYRDSYIPITTFVEKAQEIIDYSYNKTKSAKEMTIVRLVASDDPTVYESEELSGTVRAQEQIRLASKAAIQRAAPDRRVMHHFVDETFGWEGGFFASMFWNLGQSKINSANSAAPALVEKTRLAPSAETVRLRSLIGRAYMMDLAVLATVSDVVVCTVSATGCRLLAVMMGWKHAVEEDGWVNVDGQYGWEGIAW